jgi:hypothetical protein
LQSWRIAARSRLSSAPQAARAAEIATLETRRAKDTGADGVSMREVWETKAAEIGFDRQRWPRSSVESPRNRSFTPPTGLTPRSFSSVTRSSCQGSTPAGSGAG